jgi:hypothetical protein
LALFQRYVLFHHPYNTSTKTPLVVLDDLYCN